MHIDDIQRVLVLGAGTMGRQIAFQCATHGYDVWLYDVSAEALDAAGAELAGFAEHLIARERLTPEEAKAALARVQTTNRPEEAAQVDLVSESVPEDPRLKAQVFGQFHSLCPPHTVFTTNTSTLLPSLFADATGRPAQFAALHFHLPVWDSNVVDVMPHPGTDPEIITQLQAFARRIGQVPIVLKAEWSGYVFNTMLSALLRSATTLAAQGVAEVEDIDRAWMGVMGTGMGPFGIMDMVGLETVWQIVQFWANALQDAELQRNADFYRTYLDQGRLGRKNGRGFYDYPNPAFQQPGFVAGNDG